ncbi:MAG TPA: OmpA family protein [Segetibacter sp.]
MNNKFLLVAFALCSLLFTSCVAKSKLLFAEDMANRLRSDSAQMMNRIGQLDRHISSLDQKITQLESSRKTLQQQLDATAGQLDQTKRAASGEKARSEEQIAEQQRRLEQLQGLIEQQRKNREELRKQISDALVNFKSNELTVSIKNGKVYVSLQESLLFPSGSAVVNPKGKEALGTLAAVLNQNPDINVLIEGHTDSIPMKGKYSDNWELSVERSTAIVRILTDTYKVEPARVTASGRSKYEPVDNNTTAEGRARNRRTEIILEPKLNELMRLIQQD